MRVLVAGAHGRLGSRIVALLLSRGHHVRAFVRTEDQAAALRGSRVDAVVGDLRGDVEWAAEGCDATIFAAGARHRGDLGAIDGGGASKVAEAADRYEHARFVLCSVVGADHPERRDGGVREFLEAKRHAEQRVAALDLPWTVLRFGRLTEDPGGGRITPYLDEAAAVSISRDDAALTAVEALVRSQLSRVVVPVVTGDRHVTDALDGIEPHELPPPPPQPTGATASLGAAQSDNPRDDPEMLAADATPLDTDVDWEGDGPVPPEPVGNEDPAPGIP
jgi:uncharacterized protein YbjT (DUF2867 family)